MYNIESAAVSCQQLASWWLDTISFGGIVLVVSVSSVILLKILATLYLTNQIRNQFVDSIQIKDQKLPAWLLKVLTKNNFSPKQILIDHKNQSPNALTVGFIRPIIVINRNLLRIYPKKQAEAVILHEIYHAQKLHPFWATCANLITEILFFLPLVYGLRHQFVNYCEQAADRFAVQQQETNLHLLAALKSVLSKDYEDWNTSGVIAFGATSVENRITAIKERRFVLNRPGSAQLVITILMILTVGFLTISRQQIKASIDLSLETESTQSQCNVIQCASRCFAKIENYSPSTLQSEL